MPFGSTEKQRPPRPASALSVLRAQVESQTEVDVDSGLAARRTLFALAGGSPLPRDIDLAMKALGEFERAIVEDQPSDSVERRRTEVLAALDAVIARSSAS